MSGTGFLGTHEAGNAARIAYYVPGVVVHLKLVGVLVLIDGDLNKHIAREYFAFYFFFGSVVTYFGNGFRGNLYFKNLVMNFTVLDNCFNV